LDNDITTNYLLNLFNNILNVLFPLIIFPYIIRIFGPEIYGSLSFAKTVVGYFMLFLTAGISTFGMREISKYKEDKSEASNIFLKLEIIKVIILIIISIIYFILINYIKIFRTNYLIYLILYFQLLLSIFNFNWAFKGLNKYRYLIFPEIIKKVIILIFTFMLVNGKSDIYIYLIINILGLFFSSILKLNYINRFIDLRKKYIKGSFSFIKDHYSTIIWFFLSMVATQLYVNIDIVMLGFLNTNKEVGYYSAVVKIIRAVILLATSLGPIILGKVSYEYNNSSIKKVENVWKKAFGSTIMILLPITFGGYFLSKDIVHIILGKDFIPAINSFRVLILLPLITSFTYFFTAYVFIPLDMEKIFSIITIFTSLINIILNFIFIPFYGSLAASVTTIISELFLLFVGYKFLPEKAKIIIKYKNYKGYVYGSLLFLLYIKISHLILDISIYRLAFDVIISSFIYFIFLYKRKNPILQLIINKLKNIFHK